MGSRPVGVALQVVGQGGRLRQLWGLLDAGERAVTGEVVLRRSDRGMAQALTAEQRDLLLAIRRDLPRTSTSLLVRTWVVDGRLPDGAVRVGKAG